MLREDRPGSSVARNRGIAETDAEIIAFTDDDVVVDPRWLDWLVAPFEDPAVDATTGMVMPLMLQSEAQKRFEQFAGFSRGVSRRSYGLHANRADDRLLFPYWGGMFGSGNSMAFRRRPFVSIGGFDPVLGAGSPTLSGADIDAMSKAILHGGTLVYEPRSVCWHEHRHDTEALRKQLYNYGAGFTAILTKAATSDREFYASARRSVPVMVKLMIERRNAPPEKIAAALPAEYSNLGRQGMLRGPILYARGRRWAKRLKLEEVIAGG
jgi:GT2 family glycosyltransferase